MLLPETHKVARFLNTGRWPANSLTQVGRITRLSDKRRPLCLCIRYLYNTVVVFESASSKIFTLAARF